MSDIAPGFYHAELLGGPEDGIGVMIPQPFPRFEMTSPIKDESGRVLRRRVDVYILESTYPHPVYRYQRSFEVVGERGPWKSDSDH